MNSSGKNFSSCSTNEIVVGKSTVQYLRVCMSSFAVLDLATEPALGNSVEKILPEPWRSPLSLTLKYLQT